METYLKQHQRNPSLSRERYKRELQRFRDGYANGITGCEAAISLLDARVELLKEDAIGQAGDEVAKMHGAIQYIRSLIADVERNGSRQRPQRDERNDF